MRPRVTRRNPDYYNVPPVLWLVFVGVGGSLSAIAAYQFGWLWGLLTIIPGGLLGALTSAFVWSKWAIFDNREEEV